MIKKTEDIVDSVIFSEITCPICNGHLIYIDMLNIIICDCCDYEKQEAY